ncbi:MAG: DNA polymerase III subunit gamma/tau [Candidatus Bipolaricaulia bacterium]
MAERVQQALYRRWRPQRFGEVVDQEYTVKTLQNAVAQGRLHHAYLFAGPRGTGKTSVARILAKAINCEAPQDGEPCNECPTCRRIGRGISLDVIEIDGASNRGIDQIRQLREEVNFVPAETKYKVYIIDEVHMLTNEAFNALLKTLEEPPRRVIFIFATTEPHKLPPTVASRCQAFEFKLIPPELIERKLREICAAEGTAASSQALEAIARRARGSLRDAEVLIEQLASYKGAGEIGEEDLLQVLGLPSEELMADFEHRDAEP